MPETKTTIGNSIAGLLVLSLVGCGGDHGPHEKYYLLASNIKLPYWQAAAAGLRQAARQIQVSAEMVGPDTYDPKQQQLELKKLIQRKPAGIMVSAADPELIRADIDAAVAAGIPVITMDSDAPASKRLVFVGTNNYQAGVMGGEVAARLLHGKGNIVFLTMPGQLNLIERLNGYKFVLAQHPQIKISEIVDIRGDPVAAFETAKNLLEKTNPRVDAFICLEAIAGKEVAEVLDRNKATDRTVVAMDTDEGTLEWVEKGRIAATIAQKPFTMAFQGLKLLDDLRHHHTPGAQTSSAQDTRTRLPSIVDTGATLIDKTNLEAFRQAGAGVKSP